MDVQPAKIVNCKSVKLIILIYFLSSSLSFALSPESHLANEAQEQRAMKLFLEVRCLVCHGQVIENSNTEFAFEMRKLIRQKISQGENDQQIKKDLVKEFGSDILTYSNFGRNNFLLWLLPITLAVILPLIVFVTRRHH